MPLFRFYAMWNEPRVGRAKFYYMLIKMFRKRMLPFVWEIYAKIIKQLTQKSLLKLKLCKFARNVDVMFG